MTRLLSIAIFFSAWIAPLHAAEFLGERVIGLSRAYIPDGFDNDDSVEIVVEGELPSSCFKVGTLTTELTRDQVIRLKLSANEFAGECYEGPVPYHQVVSLGRLREVGTYTIVDGVSGENLGTLDIVEAARSEHGTDRRLYAPLTDANVLRDGERPMLRLSGFFPDSCLDFTRVRMRASEDVLVVLPEIGHAPTAACRKGRFPFERDFAVEAELPNGTFLLHARSMSGRAINKLIVAP